MGIDSHRRLPETVKKLWPVVRSDPEADKKAAIIEEEALNVLLTLDGKGRQAKLEALKSLLQVKLEEALIWAYHNPKKGVLVNGHPFPDETEEEYATRGMDKIKPEAATRTGKALTAERLLEEAMWHLHYAANTSTFDYSPSLELQAWWNARKTAVIDRLDREASKR